MLQWLVTTSQVRTLLVMSVLIWIGAGCAQKKVPVYPVGGRITYNGKPVPKATLYFISVGTFSSKDLLPRAVTREDGTFAVSTYHREDSDQPDGAPAGEYRISIIWAAQKSAIPGPPLDLLGGRYSDPERSGLRARVDADGNNELAINLK